MCAHRALVVFPVYSYTYLILDGRAQLVDSLQLAYQRFLLPHRKSALICPILTLWAELQIEAIQHPRHYETHLVVSHTVAIRLAFLLSHTKEPNLLLAHAVLRPKRERLQRSPLIVCEPLIAEPALRQKGQRLLEIALRRVAGQLWYIYDCLMD